MNYQALNRFDAFLIEPMNSLVGRRALFDSAVGFLTDNPLISALLVMVFWAYWFRPGDLAKIHATREHLIATLWAGIAAIVVGRALALELPFRLRPRYEPSRFISYVAGPHRASRTKLLDWSAFPSDHAALYAALAVGLCFCLLATGAGGGAVCGLLDLLSARLPRLSLSDGSARGHRDRFSVRVRIQSAGRAPLNR